MKTLVKKIPIFGGRITIILVDKLQKIEKRYNLTDTYDCDALTFKHSTPKCKRMYVVAFEISEITTSTLAHEAIHIANFILEDIHHKISTHNDEVQCYVTGWVVDQITKMLQKEKIKIKTVK